MTVATQQPEPTRPRFDRRLRVASLLVAVGLLIETATLFWTSPATFLTFLVPGAVLVILGVLIYLWSLVVRRSVG